MDAKKIGKHIALLRKQNNLSQKELADMLDITPQAVSKWERGKSMPTFALLLQVCDVLNTTPDELFIIARTN